MARESRTTATSSSSVDYLLEQNSTRPVSVKEVEVSGDGAQTLRDGLLQQQFEPLFQSRVLSELLSQLESTAIRIKGFGLHDSIAYKLDLVEDVDGTKTLNNEILNLKAGLTLEDTDSYWWTACSLSRDNEAGLNVSAGLKNLFGGAESLSVDVDFATRPRDRSSFTLNLSSPIGGSPYTRAILSSKSIFQSVPWASHSQEIRGLTAKLAAADLFSSGSVTQVAGEFGLEATNRSVVGVGAAASDTVRASTGDNLKVGFNGSINIDTRNDIYYPTSGYSLAVAGEAVGSKVGLPGDVSFLKGSILASTAYSLDPAKDRLVVNLSTGSGVLLGDKTSIFDRFYLGGSKDIYGFQYNGLGPKDDSDIVGGHGFALGNISIFAKIPRLVDISSPLRAVFLFNGASLVSSQQTDSSSPPLFKNLLGSIFSHPSTAAAIGLTYRSKSAQLELIYSVPLSTNSHDLSFKGLQFGVGLSI